MIFVPSLLFAKSRFFDYKFVHIVIEAGLKFRDEIVYEFGRHHFIADSDLLNEDEKRAF